ncbi:Bax inhibitor-1/YccA family protein [Corynebacterium otitidis]|uniref:Putative membrane protein n=1 Tax=Corynebacterium otitidis ATCC 51513 TaxID=883169 RepID=I7JVJ3_9CORY|nr:Bax inhibitor-1/YccA family protein [Corynebacterium otitidis]EJZ82700.1 hypothetical protein HMPREF9719_00358 [Corynebacterium otitidis ATCC 51513]CCI82936.1 putative membrane protein [Corynebacterium otitidis ATCC 51513]
MRSNNPVMARLPGAERYTEQGQNQGYQGFGSPAEPAAPAAPPRSQDRPITVDDVVIKTGITLAIIVAAAAVSFGLSVATGNPGISMLLTGVGAIGGFITVLVWSFKRNFGSPATTITYAVFEGLFVGGFSMVFSGVLIGNENAGAIIAQAIVGTLGVFAGMLVVYKVGAIKVTNKFSRVLTACIAGVAVLLLVNLVVSLFTGGGLILRDAGPIGIIFSLVCIVLAALSFLQDFDVADKLVRAQAPSKEAWGVALGLAVTLVWLYTEILRLIAIFARSDN